MEIAPSKAAINLVRNDDEANRLKRLALLFDEIHFTRPTFAAVTDETAAIIKSGGPKPITIDVTRDVRSMEILSLEGETEEVLNALVEAGVAFEQRSSCPIDRRMRRISIGAIQSSPKRSATQAGIPSPKHRRRIIALLLPR